MTCCKMVFRTSRKNSKVFKFNKVFAKLIVPSMVGSSVLSPFSLPLYLSMLRHTTSFWVTKKVFFVLFLCGCKRSVNDTYPMSWISVTFLLLFVAFTFTLNKFTWLCKQTNHLRKKDDEIILFHLIMFFIICLTLTTVSIYQRSNVASLFPIAIEWPVETTKKKLLQGAFRLQFTLIFCW